MRAAYLIIIFALAGLTACKFETQKKQEPDITQDTLTYAYQTINLRADDCGDKPDSACTVVNIKYPLFVERDALNDTVTKKLTGLFGFFQDSISLKEMGEHFLTTYYNFKHRNKRSEIFFTLNSNAQVLRQDSNLTTIETNSYTFQGGAHGGNYTFFINWDTKADKNLTLEDILINGYKPKLTQIADTIFRQQEKLADTSSLAKDYFFKDDKFKLNRNFSVTPLGLKFVYNIYEIKPYAAGCTELLIPYSKIKSLLKPNTVITQYIK
ncbi:MAG: DUF3298 domain-containing protein [Sphingobacteriaceae bacterium]|nr:MAG: DUF3298 domain-containing protein [Sphingobacteriaceae bacterium]